MRTAFRFTSIAAGLLASISIGHPVAAHAASCELSLKAHYRCSATYDGGGSSEYCAATDILAPGDGRFVFYEDGSPTYFCTCAARGKAPNVSFGGSSRDFFCGSGEVTLAGKVSGSRLVGQGYQSTFPAGSRSTFTCRAVETCP